MLHELDPKQLCSFLPSQQNGFLNMTIHWRNLVNNSGGGGGGGGKQNRPFLLSSTQWQKELFLAIKNIGGICPILHPTYVT